MKKIIKIALVVLLILFAWSPWIGTTKADNIILQKVNAKWQGVMDGCGPLKATDIKDTKKIPFGALSSIRYACGFITQETAQRELNDWHTIYVSPFENVVGNY